MSQCAMINMLQTEFLKIESEQRKRMFQHRNRNKRQSNGNFITEIYNIQNKKLWG